MYHLICSPERCIQIVVELKERRRRLLTALADGGNLQLDVRDPCFVWEPVPDSCRPSEFGNFLRALEHINVVSPNEDELMALYGGRDAPLVAKSRLQRLYTWCEELLQASGNKAKSAVVIRRGKDGCYVATSTCHTWLPAYHNYCWETTSKEDINVASQIVDPTGAGNAFLGGFCMGLLQHAAGESRASSLQLGAVYGSVAASFVVEQVGMPKLSMVNGEELWNGESVGDRVEKFHQRTGSLEHAAERLEIEAFFSMVEGFWTRTNAL